MIHRPLFPVLLLAAISLAGLVVGLIGDAWEDVLANLALALCLVPIVWALRKG